MYTGNICNHGSNHIARPVYPCVYREHVFKTESEKSEYGLSLCVQGTCSDDFTKRNFERFIPVCTGNINNGELACIFSSVYPCVYREHKLELFFDIMLSGLSLCVQGTLVNQE